MSKEKKDLTKETSVEVQTIEKKLQEIRNQHTVKTKTRNDLVRQIQQIDEEIVKLVGAHQSLQEVLKELTKDVVADKNEEETTVQQES